MGGEFVNRIVSINFKNGEDIQILVEGYDFYVLLCLSVDVLKFCWISWNYLNMFWDGIELWVVQVKIDGLLNENQFVVGGKEEFIF